MVTYAEQTDKKKAQQSSVDLDKPIETSTPTKVEPTAVAQTAVAQIAPTPQPTPQTTPVEQKQAPAVTGSYYKDVYLPKVQAQKAKRMWEVQNVEMPAPSKAQTMDVTTLAQAYDIWDVSAIDLENLKQTDPLKYQETKLAIDRKRTLDLINQTAQQQVDTYKQLWESYLKKWDEIAASDEGKTLREEVFAQYWLNESNEKIKKYSNEIDRLDEELEKVNEIWFSADAFADRWRRTTAMRELTKQRNDVAKLRANEIDYYRLWLEQADAVVSDYKEYKAQEIAQLGVKFEMMTGMSQMEFSQRDAQNKQYLADIDNSILENKADILAQQKTESDRFYAWSLLSLYDEFSDESKAVLSNLPPERLEAVLNTYADKTKQAEDKYYKELDYKYKDKELEMKQAEYNLKVRESAMKNIETVKLDDWSIVLVNKETWETSSIYNTPSSSPIKFNEPEIKGIVDFCITNRGGRTNVQCWELVNDYWTKQMWYKIGMQDTYDSKVKAIQWAWQSFTPIAWWVFAFPWGEYGHTGIVTKVMEDWSIEVLEANREWTSKWSYPELNTYSASKVKSMVFSMPPATWEEYSVDFNDIQLPTKATEYTTKSLTFWNRMREAHEKMLALWLEDIYAERNPVWQERQDRTFQVFKSTSQKDLEIYKTSFINAVLRLETWSSIAPTEYRNNDQMYFPQPWDSKETIQKKQVIREQAIKWMYQQAKTDVSWVPIADYYDPSLFRSRIEKLNTPQTQYQDEVDNELAQYWIGSGILDTVPSFN